MAIVYLHLRKDTGEVFYVGIGQTESRAYDTKNRKNKYWTNIYNKVGRDVEIVLENITWEEACQEEVKLIAFYGRKDLGKGSLVNMTNGGEGLVNPSDEVRNKLRYEKSEYHKELLRNYQKGIKQSRETIEKRVSTGYHKTEEYKQKQRQAHLGIPRSEETKQKLRKPKPPRTKEHADKISQANKGRPSPTRGVRRSPVWEFEKQIKELREQGWSLKRLRDYYKCGETTLLKILNNLSN